MLILKENGHLKGGRESRLVLDIVNYYVRYASCNLSNP